MTVFFSISGVRQKERLKNYSRFKETGDTGQDSNAFVLVKGHFWGNWKNILKSVD